MAKQDYSKDLKKALRKAGITAPQKAFADLLILGWDEMDAYLASSLYNPAYSLAANVQDMNNLRSSAPFTAYYNDRVALLNKDADQAIENAQQMAFADTNADFRSKEYIIDQLAATLTQLRGKDRADVLMKIADLQRMKNEEIKEEEKLTHFYLPIACPKTCKLFKQ